MDTHTRWHRTHQAQSSNAHRYSNLHSRQDFRSGWESGKKLGMSRSELYVNAV